MERALKAAMKFSISEVLETMFFMSAEFPETGGLEEIRNSTRERIFASSLTFSGNLSGRFLFFTPRGLLAQMTEDFMGMEKDSVSIHDMEGTLKEILNMIAGNTFSNLDHGGRFSIDIPEVIDIHQIPEMVASPVLESIFVGVETIAGPQGLKLEYEHAKQNKSVDC